MALGYRQIVKNALNRFGLDLVRTKNSPRQTLLGLRARPFRTVIDVGANSGQFAREISKFFPYVRLHCFEPLPGPFQLLKSWSQSQHGRVIPYNLAIGETNGSAEMYLHVGHTPSSSLLPTTELSEQDYPFTKQQRTVIVKQKTLDSVLEGVQESLSSEILIKLDVQGYENRVIAGAGRTFAKASACIVEVCLDRLYEGQADFPGLLAMLTTLGFRYVGNLNQAYADDGRCSFLDAVFVRGSFQSISKSSVT